MRREGLDLAPAPSRLVGVSERDGPRTHCSLVFHLEDPTGMRFNLRLYDILEALRFAERQRVVEPLSAAWWACTEFLDGCSVQDETGTDDGP